MGVAARPTPPRRDTMRSADTDTDTDTDDTYSIGRAASVSGISCATLRMWERRYGRPVPVRLPSGHRRYTADQVRWLKRVAEALARGARASEAVEADEAGLDALLGAETRKSTDPAVERLVQHARAFRSRELVADLQAAWKELGARRFLLERIAPFTTELGRAWADGRVEIRHEHHATAHVDDLLRVLRRTLPAPESDTVLVLTTLPGETHGLGLQMVAMLSLLEGVAVRVLGTETPIEEIVATARETGADAVGIGVSLSTGGPDTDRVLATLRRALPDDVRLIVGGAGARGARRGPRSIEYARDLREMAHWLRDLRVERAA